MENMIEIRPGRRIHLLINETSAAQPTVFCIHGLGGSAQQWREQIPLLQQYRLIIPDLLGHGQSDKPKPGHHNPYTFNEFSLDLQALFEKYAGEYNIIMGHSYGGALATDLALRNSKQTQKLILFAPMPCQPVTTLPLIYRLPAWLLEILRPYLEKNFRAQAFTNQDSPRLLAEEDKAGKTNLMYVIKGMLRGRDSIPALDPATITTPTLIIAGVDDKLIPLALLKTFYDKLPAGHIEVIADAAHMVMLEQPQHVATLLLNFLQDEFALAPKLGVTAKS